jgi:hypothetical protein
MENQTLGYGPSGHGFTRVSSRYSLTTVSPSVV